MILGRYYYLARKMDPGFTDADTVGNSHLLENVERCFEVAF